MSENRRLNRLRALAPGAGRSRRRPRRSRLRSCRDVAGAPRRSGGVRDHLHVGSAPTSRSSRRSPRYPAELGLPTRFEIPPFRKSACESSRIVVALLIVASFLFVPQAVQAIPPGCTEVGTAERDVMAGYVGTGQALHARRRGLCPRRQRERRGPRRLRAADTLIAGDGQGPASAGAGGDDRLFSVDNDSQGRHHQGRRGHRLMLRRRKEDRFRGCERRYSEPARRRRSTPR